MRLPSCAKGITCFNCDNIIMIDGNQAQDFVDYNKFLLKKTIDVSIANHHAFIRAYFHNLFTIVSSNRQLDSEQPTPRIALIRDRRGSTQETRAIGSSASPAEPRQPQQWKIYMALFCSPSCLNEFHSLNHSDIKDSYSCKLADFAEQLSKQYRFKTTILGEGLPQGSTQSTYLEKFTTWLADDHAHVEAGSDALHPINLQEPSSGTDEESRPLLRRGKYEPQIAFAKLDCCVDVGSTIASCFSSVICGRARVPKVVICLSGTILVTIAGLLGYYHIRYISSFVEPPFNISKHPEFTFPNTTDVDCNIPQKLVNYIKPFIDSTAFGTAMTLGNYFSLIGKRTPGQSTNGAEFFDQYARCIWNTPELDRLLNSPVPDKVALYKIMELAQKEADQIRARR